MAGISSRRQRKEPGSRLGRCTVGVLAARLPRRTFRSTWNAYRVAAWLLGSAWLSQAEASDFSGLIPGLKEAKDAALVACYSAHKNEKELHDVSARISTYNKMQQVFGQQQAAGGNDVRLDALKQVALQAWPRYQELGGPAKTMGDVQTTPDPCANVRKAF